jgi:hypothetical protein
MKATCLRRRQALQKGGGGAKKVSPQDAYSRVVRSFLFRLFVAFIGGVNEQ